MTEDKYLQLTEDFTPVQHAETAIRCAQLVCSDLSWNVWAANWLSGEDRSEKTAWIARIRTAAWAAWKARATEAAAWAAEAAAWVTEDAAWVTRAAAWAAEATNINDEEIIKIIKRVRND